MASAPKTMSWQMGTTHQVTMRIPYWKCCGGQSSEHSLKLLEIQVKKPEESINARTAELHGHNSCVYTHKQTGTVDGSKVKRHRLPRIHTAPEDLKKAAHVHVAQQDSFNASLAQGTISVFTYYKLSAHTCGLCCSHSSGFVTWPLGCCPRGGGGWGRHSRAKAAGIVWGTVSGGSVPSGARSWEWATSRAILGFRQVLGASWNGPKLTQGGKIQQNGNLGPTFELCPWLSRSAAQTCPRTKPLSEATEFVTRGF